MNIKELIIQNDTLAFLFYSKKIKKDDALKYMNNEIKYQTDTYNNYSFMTFVQLDDKIGYKVIQLADIKDKECERLYNKYQRYKKIITFNEI
jgi:hypothetical protein